MSILALWRRKWVRKVGSVGRECDGYRERDVMVGGRSTVKVRRATGINKKRLLEGSFCHGKRRKLHCSVLVVLPFLALFLRTVCFNTRAAASG